MTLEKVIKRISKFLRKTCFIHPVTEDNLSETLKELLENHPVLLKNKLPEIYNNLIVIINLDNIKD